MRRSLTTAALLAGFLASLIGCKPAEPPKTERKPLPAARGKADIIKRAKKAAGRGVAYLIDHRGKDGVWDAHPGVTGIVLLAILNDPEGYNDREDPFVRDPVKYLVALQKDNGAIYEKELANYVTAIALRVIIRTNNPKYADVVRNARGFLVLNQLDEGEGYKKSDPGYGGMGYGSTRRPDMSNTQIAADALKAAEEAGLEKDTEAWTRMVVFMSRCQNRSESNPMKWAGNDGGVVYTPWKSKAEEILLPDGRTGLRSYGSMTYAFLKTMIYAEVSKDDARVQAAYDWVCKHYTVEENPGIGQQGLYYYYHTMAKALRVFGKDDLVDQYDVSHDWRSDLIEKLLSLQREDGSWVNANDSWFEASPNLVTAYAVLTLQELLKD